MGSTGVDDLERRLAAVCGHVNAVHAQLVDLVAEALQSGVWQGWGIRSLAHWLTWQAGISPTHAAELVRVAEAKVTHPAIMGVFADGELSLDQAAVAVKVPAHCDTQVAELAKLSTVVQLRTVVRAARPAAPTVADPTTNPGSDDAEPAAPVESVSTWTDDDGRVHLHAELDADHGAVVLAALAAARDRLFRDGDRAVTWVDALMDVCQRSIDGENIGRRERFRVNVFLDPTADVPATWSDGSAVPDAIRRYLTCDCTLTPTFVAGGLPVSVGRATKVVPDRTRRLVERRDGKCRVPWCPHTRWLQIHHIVHWDHYGPTDTANLCAICPGCHRLHHRGLLAIGGNADRPDGLTFTDRHVNGRPMTTPPQPTKPVAPPPTPRRPYRHPLGERLHAKWLNFPDNPNAPPEHDVA